MFNQRLAYTNRLQLLIVYVFMCNNLETMKNKHEMSGKGKTVVFPCDNMLVMLEIHSKTQWKWWHE